MALAVAHFDQSDAFTLNHVKDCKPNETEHTYVYEVLAKAAEFSIPTTMWLGDSTSARPRR